MWNSSEINGYGLRASDGAIGSISDLLFDDASWTVRWIVVDTGRWLPGRKVLLPPSVLGQANATQREFSVDLTSKRIESAPGLETDAPVSRQFEAELFSYYDWPPYWHAGLGPPAAAPAGGVAAVTVSTAAAARSDDPAAREKLGPEERDGDPHLRSTGEVNGYYVEARDGNIGHIEDFLIDEDDWVVRYLIIDTKNWWPGKMVLISPRWLTGISWPGRQVSVDLDREAVKNSPEYNPADSIGREYEARLHQHYGFPTYWGGAWV